MSISDVYRANKRLQVTCSILFVFFLPNVLLKIANRSNQKESFSYKIISRIKHHDLRHFRYNWDSIFNEEIFENTLKENHINPSYWMLNVEMDNQDLSDILTFPEYQYS